MVRLEEGSWIKEQYEDRYQDEKELTKHWTLNQQWTYAMTHPWRLSSTERIKQTQAMEKQTHERKQMLAEVSQLQHSAIQSHEPQSRILTPEVIQEKLSCQCLTKKGRPCLNPALKGQLYCVVHFKNCPTSKTNVTSPHAHGEMEHRNSSLTNKM